MPKLSGDIVKEGAFVSVRFAWGHSDAQRQRAARRPVPPPVNASAILDSGAEVTCLDNSLVQAMSLPFGNMSAVNLAAAGGLSFAVMYDVDLMIIHPSGDSLLDLSIRDMQVLELPLGNLGYQALIGRDLLSRCAFLYHGPRGRFRLAY